MTVFFTADTHFGHGGAMGLFRRPFSGTREMDETLIANWNAVVGPEDTVWHLGDFADRPSMERATRLLESLNGTKHLIPGNNDPDLVRAHPAWASVSDYVEMELDGRMLRMCHYPFRSWRDDRRGAWNLHGHSHGRLKPLTRQRDVGVDVWDFRPVTLDVLTRRWTRKG